MAASNVLREFLVSLGFKVDEAGFRKFGSTIVVVTETVIKLGATVEGLVLGIEALALKFASVSDRLYWFSQRTGAPIKTIKSLEFAFSQVGSSVEGADNALQGFSDFLRTYGPGAQQYIARLGVDAGRFKDNGQLMVAVLQKLATLSPMQQNVFGGRFGFDVPTLLAGGRDLLKWVNLYEQSLKKVGLDQDKVGENSAHFMQSMRTIWADLSVIGEKVFSDLLVKYGPKLDEFSTYLGAHLGDIATRIETIIDKLLKLSDALERNVQSIGGWKTAGEALLYLWAGGIALSAIGNIVKFGAALRLLTMGGTAAGAGSAAAAVGGSGLGGTLALAAGGALAAGAGIAYLLHKYGNSPDTEGYIGGSRASPGRHISQQAIDIAASLQKFGLSRENAAGILANMAPESRLNPFAHNASGRGRGAYGLAQWRGTRLDDYKKMFGHNIWDVTDPQTAMSEQLQFLGSELQGKYSGVLRGLKGASAGLSAYLFEKGFEISSINPAEVERIANNRALHAGNILGALGSGATLGSPKGGTTVNQTNNISTNISSSDPHTAGKAAGAAIGDTLPRLTARMFANPTH